MATPDMATPALTLRQATGEDLEVIVELTRSGRRQLARWSPIYFNPREGADEGHAGFLSFLVASEDHRTVVAVENGEVVGFFVDVEQPTHRWIDDLWAADERRLAQIIATEADGRDDRWLTCVSVEDRFRAAALSQAGLSVASLYYARSLEPAGPLELAEPADSAGGAAVDFGREVSAEKASDDPVHTFGGQAFAPSLPGALVVVDGQAGYAIGSPSASPPIYDPGGPTCVVDQVAGSDRRGLVARAMDQSAARGDAQMVVVCRAGDTDLRAIVESLGFVPEVEVFLNHPRAQ